MKKMNPWLMAMLLGLLCLILMLALTAIAAKLVEGGQLSTSATPIISYGILAIASLGGCLTTSCTAKQFKLPMTMLTAAIYFLLLCIMNGILQRGEFQRLLPTAGVIFGAALLASLIGAKGKRNRYG